MDVESPKGSQRLRARPDRHGRPQALRVVFRIEDEAGRVLRRIQDARTSQEAIALYWRTVGAAMPEAMMGKDLERRIGRARAVVNRDRLQTPELPFKPDPLTGETEAKQDGGEAPYRVKRSRPKQATTALPQIDLFSEEAPAPVDASPPEAVVPPEPMTEPDAEPTPEVVPERRRHPEPRLVDPQLVMLQQVDSRNLRTTDRADSYLYHVTNGPDAEAALKNGLMVSTSDPMILTERQGVAYWLSVLAEDYDYIMDGPADFVVLRMRRMAVEELLEHDPHASRSAGCPCYLLTGGAASREHDEAARRR